MVKERQAPPGILLCILMDAIGYLSFAVPGLGEFSDIIWAPISGFVFYKLFGGRFGLTGAILNFAEEILPFTDFIPSFSIAWLIKYISQGKNISGPLTGSSQG